MTLVKIGEKVFVLPSVAHAPPRTWPKVADDRHTRELVLLAAQRWLPLVVVFRASDKDRKDQKCAQEELEVVRTELGRVYDRGRCHCPVVFGELEECKDAKLGRLRMGLVSAVHKIDALRAYVPPGFLLFVLRRRATVLFPALYPTWGGAEDTPERLPLHAPMLSMDAQLGVCIKFCVFGILHGKKGTAYMLSLFRFVILSLAPGATRQELCEEVYKAFASGTFEKWSPPCYDVSGVVLPHFGDA